MFFVMFLTCAFLFDVGVLWIGFRVLAAQGTRFEEIAFWPLLIVGAAITMGFVFFFIHALMHL